MVRIAVLFGLISILWTPLWAQEEKAVISSSTADFLPDNEGPRKVFYLNPGWRFFKGDCQNAIQPQFNDQNWQTVNLPHGIELLPEEASGGINYQGIACYRKHFSLPPNIQNKKITIHFEAIMGKSKIYLNGQLIKEHFGGYLPVVCPLEKSLNRQGENVLTIICDNRNDPLYPPGREQFMLDFCYFGGIYRDCYLIAHEYSYFTDINGDPQASKNLNGIWFNTQKLTETAAQCEVFCDVQNELKKANLKVKLNLYSLQTLKNNKSSSTKQLVYSDEKKLTAGLNANVQFQFSVKNPSLWTPQTPNLYLLCMELLDEKGDCIDRFQKNVGIRTFEFNAKGFQLNGKPYGKPVVGANRHQDFAVIGNALPNSFHIRDAIKLKNANFEVIRNAHYPQDPVFMDACDQLGLLLISNTPGWQFWNPKPIFKTRVFSDIARLVRRDANRASLWFWEPVLNETYYPDDFAKECLSIVQKQYPFPNYTPYCASDYHAKGAQYFPILYPHPKANQQNQKHIVDKTVDNKAYFVREWGDCVDNWNSHNSPSRVAREWGEIPQLVQSHHYANPPYNVTCLNMLYSVSKQYFGGSLWHSFDHQRGYHPDPFFGGVMDAFRRAKYSYFMFQSQRDKANPMVFIAHQMTPFSPKDVTVFSNCDTVRLTIFENGKTLLYKKDLTAGMGMPSPIITFKDAYNFMDDKFHKGKGKNQEKEVYLLAEGLDEKGQVIATHKVMPARRPSQIQLKADFEGIALEADGSDMVVVHAMLTDSNGNVKYLNDGYVHFSIQGEGLLMANEQTQTNPYKLRGGMASIIVRSTLKPGPITITATVLKQGDQTAKSATLTIHSQPSKKQFIYRDSDLMRENLSSEKLSQQQSIDPEERALKESKLQETEKLQEAFGEKRKR